MRRVPALLAALALLSGCVVTTQTFSRVVVFAASSLSGPFTSLGKTFEGTHPGVTVTFSFDGSSALVDQLQQGAYADVFASADRYSMSRVEEGSLVYDSERFATNTLTLIVPAGNPAQITGLDASLDGKKLVTCAEGVPCGDSTRKLADLLRVVLRPVSEETKVTDVRSKVESGQADAGIVYVTDARVAGAKVQTIPITGTDQVRNDYLIALVGDTKNAPVAADFMAFVTGPEGQRILADAGFGAP